MKAIILILLAFSLNGYGQKLNADDSAFLKRSEASMVVVRTTFIQGLKDIRKQCLFRLRFHRAADLKKEIAYYQKNRI